MTIVLISCKTYVTFRSIALKMGVLDVKNVQKHGFSPFSQFATFPYPGIVKMYLCARKVRKMGVAGLVKLFSQNPHVLS